MTPEYDMYEAPVLALLIRSDYAAQVFSRVTPNDFGQQLRPFVQAAYDLFQEGKEVDGVTVAERMEAEGFDKPLALILDVHDQMSFASIERLDDYCEILTSRGHSRALQMAHIDADRVLDEERDPAIAHQRILEIYERVNQRQREDSSLWDMQRASREFLEEMERRVDAGGELIGLSTGWNALDGRLNGMRPGDFIVVAGRPGMGKSTFALNIVRHNAVVDSVPTLVFSLEMTAPQLIEKMTADIGPVNLTELRRGTLSEGAWANFSAASQRIQKAPLFIDDRAGLSVAQMKARAIEIKRRCGSLGLIMVDYIQLMNAKGNSRNDQITDITKGLKEMAKELGCPLIGLSQLSRAVESRQDKRPNNSDLRESGSIEQDADIIIFPYRDSYYDRDAEHPDPTCEIIFSKIRMGEPGSEGLEWQGHYSRFMALEHRPDFELIRKQKQQETDQDGTGRRGKQRAGMEL